MKNLILLIALIVAYHCIGKAEGKVLHVDNRLRIVVIDTGITKGQARAKSICRDTENRPMVFSGNPHKSPFWNHSHGINIINIIASKINKEKYCIISIRGFDDPGDNFYVAALEMAGRFKNVVGVNLSIASGKFEPGQNPYQMREHAAITRLLLNGARVHVAAGNIKHKMTFKKCKVFPACLANYYHALGFTKFVVVESSTGWFSNKSESFKTEKRNGVKQGKPPLNGTSQATANYTGEVFSDE